MSMSPSPRLSLCSVQPAHGCKTAVCPGKPVTFLAVGTRKVRLRNYKHHRDRGIVTGKSQGTGPQLCLLPSLMESRATEVQTRLGLAQLKATCMRRAASWERVCGSYLAKVMTCWEKENTGSMISISSHSWFQNAIQNYKIYENGIHSQETGKQNNLPRIWHGQDVKALSQLS